MRLFLTKASEWKHCANRPRKCTKDVGDISNHQLTNAFWKRSRYRILSARANSIIIQTPFIRGLHNRGSRVGHKSRYIISTLLSEEVPRNNLRTAYGRIDSQETIAPANIQLSVIIQSLFGRPRNSSFNLRRPMRTSTLSSEFEDRHSRSELDSAIAIPVCGKK